MPKERRRGPKREKEEKPWQKKLRKKICIFCKDKAAYVDYKDVTLLRKFISDRGKIRARRVTGGCSAASPSPTWPRPSSAQPDWTSTESASTSPNPSEASGPTQ